MIVSAVQIIGQAVFFIALGVGAMLVLRVVLAWLGSNPWSWLPYNLTRVTEPLVRPFRYPFSGRRTRYDLMPLVAAVLVVMNGLFVMALLLHLAGIMWELGNATAASVVVSELIKLAGLLYVVAMLLRLFLPYFGAGYGSKLMRFLYKITEPVLRPLRNALRRFVGATGPFDFTAMVAVFLVWMATGILAEMARRAL